MTPVVSRGRTSVLVAFLVMFVLCCHAASARAGEWVHRSCSFGTEYIVPEGWEGQANYGYKAQPNDNCERYYNGGGLQALADGFDASTSLSGQTWRYKAPPYATIAGGVLAIEGKARDGGVIVGTQIKERFVSLVDCETPDCHSFGGLIPITAAGATELRETAFCFGDEHGVCPAEFFEPTGDGFAAAISTILSAQIILSANVTPTASGFSGAPTEGTLTGKGTITFTAKDPGPGVYQARARIDGELLWSGTPDLDGGRCVSTGTTEGVRAFNYAQPCPTETTVHAEIDSSRVADGPHALTIEVEDAAGDVATVYSHALITANQPPPTVNSVVIHAPAAPLDRGAANGTPAPDSAVLTISSKQGRAFTRTLATSAVTLAGRLTDPTHVPIKDAQVQLLQQPVSAAAPARIATTTTRADGTWTLKAPAGPSRLIRVAYFSHLLDATPAATADLHESVQGVVSMHAPRHARVGRAVLFSGQLAGGYIPASGESVQVEIFFNGRWRTIEVLPTTSKGRWDYKYVFAVGAGSSYLFRVVTVPNGGYPFLSAHSKSVRVRVGR